MTLPAIATAQEVAAYLRVSPQFVYEHADEIGAARIGRCVRFPAENVLRWLRDAEEKEERRDV